LARIIFHEKPGCLTNGRQKALLAQAGHELEVRNILTERWTAERLRTYFGDKPVSQWFNRAAPRIKSGHVDPVGTGPDEAIALMLVDPLLIRRPLMEAGDWRSAGFDAIEVDEAVGLLFDRTREEALGIERCAHGDTDRVCATPA
jgi:nitrogenase-associated protein